MNKSIILKICSLVLLLAMCLLTVTGCDGGSAVSGPTIRDTLSSATSSDTVSGDDGSNTPQSGETSLAPDGAEEVTVTVTENLAYDAGKNPLQRGINLAGFADGIEIGYDNWMFQSEYYDVIREEGFDHVRLPVDFFNYMGGAPDYRINEEFLRKVDTVINIALSANLKIILDFHHFGELQTNVNANKQKYYKMWEQLAVRYRTYPSGLVFELINEPGNGDAVGKGGSDPFTAEKIIEIQEQAIKIIRKTNPTRIIVHATRWNNGAAQLMDTEPLLPDDKNIIMSVHCYEPMNFTHQGADWDGDGVVTKPGGQEFTDDMKYEIQLIFQMVKNYQEKYGRPVWVGEFGVLRQHAPEGARAEYAEFIVETMKDAKCGWCWFDFAGGFGIYNLSTREWRDDGVIDALMK